MHKQTFSFADGVLHIEIPRARMRVQWQPEPLAEELAVGSRRWKPFWPDFRVIIPEPAGERHAGHTVDIRINEADSNVVEQKVEAFARFKQTLPEEIIQVAGPFGVHQWALMAFMHGDEWATDLARGNPVLAYALANNSHFRGTSPEVAAVQARWHCHRKQRTLLEWLGFPGTDKVAKLLRKIPPETVTPITLHCLAHALKSDERVMELLSHLPRITPTTLDLATTLKYLDLITPKLLKEVAEKPEVPGEPAVGDMILGGLVVREKIRSKKAVVPFTGIAQVVRFHEEAEIELNAYRQRQEVAREQARRAAAAERCFHRFQRAMENQEARAQAKGQQAYENSPSLRFPPPPLPGTQDIVPLTSAKQLQDESEEQHHCVWMHADLVKKGGYFVYKILAPERATLSIFKGPWGWQKAELKAAHNRSVSSITAWVVDQWLEAFRQVASGGRG